MILYEKDWLEYPNAIPDFTTNNKSWVRISGLYKAMGIKNHLFMLALHNPELQGVDPHSKDLTKEQIYNIQIEISENPWYFFREVLRIPPLAGPDAVPFKANRGNISLFWLFFNHMTTMLIQIRQTGKSVSTDSLMIWLLMGGSVNTSMNLITKDDALRVKNVNRIKEMIGYLPYYVDLRRKDDSRNTEKITVNRLGNTYTTAVAQSSPKAALNLGRGMTIAVNHIDEIAFVNNIQVTLPALLAASSAARDGAKEAGAPYGNIFTTTPGYRSSASGAFAYKLYTEGFKWSEKLLDSSSEEELIATIKKNTPGKESPMVILEYNHRQLGYTDEWLRGKIADALSDGEDAGADFLNLWADGNETSPIDKDILKMIQNSKRHDPITTISKQGYILRWYVDDLTLRNMGTRDITIALDTSDAIGNDDIGMVIRDNMTAEVLAVGKYNETNLSLFAEWLLDLLLDYPKSVMIIERRSSGVTMLDYLIRMLPMKDEDPFKRLFNWVVDEYMVNPKFKSEVIDVPLSRRSSIVYDKYKKHFGFATGGSGKASRDNLYGTVFNQSIKYTGDSVRDKDLVEQISGLTIRNNRIDHKSGSHDDLVIAWLLGYWFLSEAKNKQFYGIIPNKVLSTVVNAMIAEQGGREEVANKNKQIKLKQSIDNILLELKTTTNPIKSKLLIGKLRHLYDDIDKKYFTGLNIESVIESIQLEKQKQSNKNRYRRSLLSA